MISQLEVLLDSPKINEHQTKLTQAISEKIQLKIKKQQEKKSCYNTTNVLVYNNLHRSPYDCGLGCFLHTITNGLLCAIENNRQYLIWNYYKEQFTMYFDSFLEKCKHGDDILDPKRLGFFFIFFMNFFQTK